MNCETCYEFAYLVAGMFAGGLFMAILIGFLQMADPVKDEHEELENPK